MSSRSSVKTVEAREILQDFSGGLNTRLAENRLQPTQTPSASNVWNAVGALKKRNGFASTAVTASGISWSLSAPCILSSGSSTRMYIRASGDSRLGLLYTDNGTTFAVVGYATGTISTTSGSPTVTGSGTTWTTDVRGAPVPGVTKGDLLVVNGEVHYIATVDSNTQLTLETNMASTVSGSAYVITPYTGASGRSAMVAFAGYMWVVNYLPTALATRAPYRVSGTTFSTVSAVPVVSKLAVHKNYMFGAATQANPSRIYWSALKDPTSWPSANIIDVAPDDGYGIEALVSLESGLLIVKRTSVYLLTGDVFDPINPTYQLTQQQAPSDFICAAPSNVAIIDGDAVLVGDSGIYTTGGGPVELMPSSQLIASRLLAYGTNSPVPSVGSVASSVFYNGRLYIAAQYSNSGAYTVLVLDENGAWWEWQTATTDYLATELILFRNNLVALSASAAYRTLLSTSSDGATAINGTYTTKVFEYPETQQFTRGYVHYKKQSAGNLTFEFSVDEGATWVSTTVAMTSGQGGGTRLKSNLITIGRIGNTIQFRVSNNTAAQDFEVYAIEFYRRPLKQ